MIYPNPYRAMLEQDKAAFESAVDSVGSKSSWWLWSIFALTTIPGMFNAMHIMSYVFLIDIPPHWCKVPQLINANWTEQQIREVSTPNANDSSCAFYNWNYTHFANIGYNETIEFINRTKDKPLLISCDQFQYNEKHPKSTIVSEWDLVCSRAPLRSFSQVVIAFGKFVGGVLFGIIADKYGRKWSFVLATFLYLVSAPLAAIMPSFIIFNIARFGIGIAGSGVYETSYTILTEVAVKKLRTLFGCMFNVSYPIGYILLPVAALVAHNWRELQLYISVPLIILLLNFWFLPESPRWLMSQNRSKDAWKILHKAGYKSPTQTRRYQEGNGNEIDKMTEINKTTSLTSVESERSTPFQRLMQSLKKVFSLFATTELRRRTFICYFAWFSASISYYSIAFNADNFTTDKYIYCALNGAVEAPGYMLSFVCLSCFGRKPVSSLLFFLSGISLLIILIIPRELQLLVIVMALIGRFCIAAVFAVIILQTSELFPTVNRNSAIGTSLTVCQLGAVAAPYIVDGLGGKEHWYLPSTVCGILSVLTGLMVFMLPETKDKPLSNTVEEVEKLSDNDKVSLRLCLKFS
ncbi:organic cation transporter protein-like isoform X2 [Lycorma delicatula]|uniref:organic cation transporter protein-like isoform X2 n=1 Tax=Lycorma delicatula TaxID=130591 RepID=UPI003F50E0CF